MEHVFTLLHSISILGTAYVGWTCGKYFKQVINNEKIKTYKDNFIQFNPNSTINEDIFCNMSTAFTGAMIGRYLWPVCIPVVVYKIETNYGKQIGTFIRSIKPKTE